MSKYKNTIFFFVVLFIGYCLLTTIIFYPRIETIFTHYAMPDIDTDGGMWYQWYSIFISQTHSLFYITNLIAYPFGYDITYLPFSNLTYNLQIFILQYVIGFSWSNLVFVTNVSSLITYPLSGIGAAFLAYYLTKNKWASAFAGLIFSFSFYHVFMSRGEESINHIELIPFYFLSLFYYLNKKNFFTLILSAFTMALLFNADAYYGFFSGILSIVIVLLYKDEPLKEKVITFSIYYISLFLILVLVNLNYFYSNLYLFNHTKAVATGRNSIPKDELLDVLFYFVPNDDSWLYQKFFIIGNFIFITIPLIAFSGLLFLKKRAYVVSLAVLLVSIVLSVYIPSLYGINLFYFKFFGIFRGVARMTLLAYLFLGIMSAVVINELPKIKKIASISKKIKIVLFIILSLIIIIDSIPANKTWYRKTDFSKIAMLYQPIKNNNNIKVIANYPMSGGCPQTYMELAQVIHNKAYACDASPFYPASQIYYKKISNINDSKTIPYLTHYEVDTILIDNNLLPNAKKINAKLLKDPRLTFIGHYSAPHDDGYQSSEDLSRDFNLYQIKKVVADNMHPQPLFSAPGHAVSYQKISPEKYIVSVSKSNSPTQLIFNSPYSEKWQLYDGDLSSVNDLGFLSKSPSNVAHTTYNEYANQWILSPDISNTGSYTATIYFQPYTQIFLFSLIQYVTFGILVLYLMYYLAYGRVEK